MIAITGGTGSVGMHLVREWLAAGESVRLLVRPDADRGRLKSFLEWSLAEDPNAFDRLEWAAGDLHDGLSLESAFDGVKCVVHAAAQVSFNRRDARAMMATNREGTANVVNAMLAVGVSDLVYISSVAALGRKPGTTEIQEDSVFEDGPEVSDYARSKYRAELEVWRGQEEGLRVLVLNPSIVVGPGDYNRSSAALLRQVAKGLKFYPTGSSGFVAATDVARAAVSLHEAGAWGERFVVNGFHASFFDVLSCMALALGQKPPKWPVHWGIGEIAWRMARAAEFLSGIPAFVTREALRSGRRHHRYASTKLGSYIDWSPQSMEQAVQFAADHYLRERFRSAS